MPVEARPSNYIHQMKSHTFPLPSFSQFIHITQRVTSGELAHTHPRVGLMFAEQFSYCQKCAVTCEKPAVSS
jgi:hypothetical protein